MAVQITATQPAQMRVPGLHTLHAHHDHGSHLPYSIPRYIARFVIAGSRPTSPEAGVQQELVLVSPAVLPKLHTLAQAMLRCRGSHLFKVCLGPSLWYSTI